MKLTERGFPIVPFKLHLVAAGGSQIDILSGFLERTNQIDCRWSCLDCGSFTLRQIQPGYALITKNSLSFQSVYVCVGVCVGVSICLRRERTVNFELLSPEYLIKNQLGKT